MIRFTFALVMTMTLPLAGFAKSDSKTVTTEIKAGASHGSKDKARKVAAQSNVPCEREAYGAAFKDAIDDRLSQFEEFSNYAIIGAGASLKQKNGEKVTVTIMLSTWVGGVETGMGQPLQYNVDLRTTHDNACQLIKVTEVKKEGERG